MTLAYLCSWADRFESYLVGNPEDRFSRDEAHVMISALPARDPQEEQLDRR